MTTITDVVEKRKVYSKEPKEPGKFKVIVLNDNYTPMEFVIAMLIKIFRQKQDDAIALTLEIHNNGKAVAGIYSHEIAEQKVIDSVTMARANGFPLELKVQAQ